MHRWHVATVAASTKARVAGLLEETELCELVVIGKLVFGRYTEILGQTCAGPLIN